MNAELKDYIESSILPRYDFFDAAHRRDHADTVISQSLNLAEIVNSSPAYINADGSKTKVNYDMVYTIAAYHDTGLVEGRETHHTVSARIIRSDSTLTRWFTPEQIDTMADAAEDHRASSKSAPRTIYGRIVAEADRIIVPRTVIKRTIQYGLSHYPELNKEEHFRRTLDHMIEKYGDGGYLKLWIAESPNSAKLEELRVIIRDEKLLRAEFDTLWGELQ